MKTGKVWGFGMVAGVLAASPLGAFAQSSVTLYGIIDAGVTYVTNDGGSHNIKMDDGVLVPNRWGLKGKEDLGGGLSAIFQLENGFSVLNGKLNQGGKLFGRQAYVGLSGGFGKLTLGRQYDFTHDYLSSFNVGGWDASGYGIHQGDFDREGGDRMNNAVKYRSPDFNGFNFGVMYSFSNQAGNFHDGSGWSAGASYAYGPLTVVGAYTYVATPTLDPYGAIGVSTFLGQTVATHGANGVVTDLFGNGSFALRSLATLGLGAQYQIGPVALLANFTDTKLKGTGVTEGRSSTMRVYEVGSTWQINPAWSAAGSYQHTTFESHHWNEVSLGLDYALSKRTTLYGTIDGLIASSGVDPVIGYSFAPALSNKQAIVRLAMTHSF